MIAKAVLSKQCAIKTLNFKHNISSVSQTINGSVENYTYSYTVFCAFGAVGVERWTIGDNEI